MSKLELPKNLCSSGCENKSNRALSMCAYRVFDAFCTSTSNPPTDCYYCRSTSSMFLRSRALRKCQWLTRECTERPHTQIYYKQISKEIWLTDRKPVRRKSESLTGSRECRRLDIGQLWLESFVWTTVYIPLVGVFDHVWTIPFELLSHPTQVLILFQVFVSVSKPGLPLIRKCPFN